MDAFSLIQDFFTHMQCQFCQRDFHPDDVELIRREEETFVVNVFCNRCNTQNGVAMVGVGQGGPGDMADFMGGNFFGPEAGGDRLYEDPELTESELERLADFAPIKEDDVLAAHEFFNTLDTNWMRHIPAERLEAIQAEIAESDSEKANSEEIQTPETGFGRESQAH